jgi:hypothetical protein
MNYPFAMKTALTIRGVTVGFECTYIGNSALEGVTGSLLVISRTTYRVGKGARLQPVPETYAVDSARLYGERSVRRRE